MSATKCFVAAKMRTLVAGAVGTLEARGAVHERNDVPRSPERGQERARGVDVYQLHRPLGARRHVMDSWRLVHLGHRTC